MTVVNNFILEDFLGFEYTINMETSISKFLFHLDLFRVYIALTDIF